MTARQLWTVEDAGDAAADAFSALPAPVYAEDSAWAPASEEILTERFADATAGRIRLHAVVAMRGAEPIARAAAIQEPAALDDEGRPEGWIGLFECLPGDDGAAAGVAALHECRRWLRAAGAGRIVLPRTDALVTGLLIRGFDQPQTILTAHNPPYYADIFAAAGALQTAHMIAYRFSRRHVPAFPPLPAGGVTVRGADLRRLDDEVRRIHEFQATTFGGGFGHLPRDAAGTSRMAARLFPLLDPDLILFAEDQRGGTLGVLICLPDAWQRRSPGTRPDRARLVSIGIAPGLRRQRIAIAMGAELARRLLAKRYRSLEGSWILGQNRPPQLLAAALGARRSREFALYTL
jgi:hypothetical protein